MALVNFLRFSADCGAIVSDEEYWNVFFRKRMHGDTLHNLLIPELADRMNMQIVYGGVGYPSLHREVVVDTHHTLRKMMNDGTIEQLERVKDVARIAFDQLQIAIRRRIDQKMEFYYGFKTDDLNRGSFQCGNETVSITSDIIIEKARKLASRENADTLLKSVLEARAAVFGYDQDGITGYYLSGENSIMGYVHEGFEAIGTGKYASGLVFGQDFKAKTLRMRQAGYDPGEGLFELIESAFLAGEHFKEVGGNYNFIMLNRAAGTKEEQYQEFFDDPARLCTEIVRAVRAGLIPRESGVSFIHQLIIEKKPFKDVEQSFLCGSTDSVALHFTLRRYKLGEIPGISQEVTAYREKLVQEGANS